MNKIWSFVLGMVFLFVVAGCASISGFNKTYMPKAVPEKPADKIVLAAEDSKVISKYISQKKLVNHVGLYWLSADTMYLNLADGAIFGINPQTKAVQELLESKAGDARRKIASRMNVEPDHEGRGIIRQFAASIFSYMGQKFAGDLTDNNHKIGVEIGTYENRNPSNNSKCETAKLKGQLINEKGKRTDVEWDYQCEWLIQSTTLKKVPQLLSTLQVSPSGKYYLYGSLLYSVDQNARVCDVLNNYSRTVAVSVNPDWTKIAVLRGKFGTYWIEIFDFQTQDSRSVSGSKAGM